MRLYKPGERKNNKYYTAVGRIDGRQYEFCTKTRNQKEARQLAKDFEEQTRADNQEQRDRPKHQSLETFAQVAEAYAIAQRIRGNDERYLSRLRKDPILGVMPIGDITAADIQTAASRIYPTASNETRNRQAITPCAAVVHWAHESGLRDYIPVKKLRENRPAARRPPEGGVLSLIEAAKDPDQRRFLIVIWAQGWRITETLGVGWDLNIDLARQQFLLWVPKSETWKTVPMHPDVLESLSNVPQRGRTGKLFPWSNRHQVYRWLDPLLLETGLAEIIGYRMVKGGRGTQKKATLKRHFTPHMTRHDFASSLNETGATPADITAAGSWTSAKSIARYTDVDQEQARTTLWKRGRIEDQTAGKTAGKKRNIK